MYDKYFGFTQKPFNVTPDSAFFFPSSKHTEALSSLVYSIDERKGFAVVTGEIGAGKTMVTRMLLKRLDSDTRVAVITNSHITTRELIELILQELEIEYKPGSKQKLLNQLNSFLIQQLKSNTNVVLIVDEAQNLSGKVLEEIRMLSNLETEREKLIQILLVGQPQLKAKLANPKLEQLRQRVAVYYHLSPLLKEETRDYILFRLKAAGARDPENLFSPDAIECIHEYTRGVPRLINLVSDAALLSGFVYELKVISATIIKEVVREREFSYKERFEDREIHIPDSI